jgi:hypothetical protein
LEDPYINNNGVRITRGEKKVERWWNEGEKKGGKKLEGLLCG